ncbi:hypothetical protein FJ251_11075 [bacterium]|nr:hypothetical protein [bacterium]
MSIANTARRRRIVIGLLWVLVLPLPAWANLSRNASGPQAMGEAGAFTLDSAAELERDGGASAWIVETGVQYALSARLQFLLEAVFYERQELAEGESASGMGDADLTLSWLLAKERGPWPPLVLAGKLKLPTARAGEIGTGKADYSLLAILAKEYGELELALETEFVSHGSPAGEALKDQFLYTLALDFSVNDYLSLYGEILGESEPVAGEGRSDAALAGFELEWPISAATAPYLSLEADTESVVALRAGIEWSW